MEFFVQNINLLLFLPLIICLIIGFNGLISNKIDNGSLFSLSASVCVINVIFSVVVFIYTIVLHNTHFTDFRWLSIDNLGFCFGTYLDNISVIFLLCATIIAFFIQILAFLKVGDSYDFPRFLFYLNLFSLGLNGIFVSSNIFQSYLFCEVVGVAGYLLLSFDFSNRKHSKIGIKSFIYNRSGDLALLLCVLIIMYFAVFYNELAFESALDYTNMNNVAYSISSIMSPVTYIIFCALLLFVVVMKFIQAFVYLYLDNDSDSGYSNLIVFQNTMFVLVGLYLFLRLDAFFFALNNYWFWLIPALVFIFILLCIVNKLFIPFCRLLHWVEKYVVSTCVSVLELTFRFLSYLSVRLQGGNFQSYIIYSLIGLILIFCFVIVFYRLVLAV